MARELIVIWAGRHRRDAWDRLCGRYRTRIGRFLDVREVAVKARRGGERREAEGEALLGALPDPCWSVALDRRGASRGSVELADWLERLIEEWPHPIAFLLGSDLGLSPRAREAARETLSLGPLTLPHELARLVLYEQLYRALSLKAGIKYHRGPL